MKDYDHVTVYKAYHKYIWNVSRTDKYKISLRRDECNNIIYQLILNANTDRSSDFICSLIHKLITTASSGILKKVNINKNNSSMKQMPANAWFDSECNELRKKRNYNTNLKVNLEEMCSNNPKEYWGFWKRLQRQNLSEITIELYQFYNCFLKQSEPPTAQNANTKFKTIQQKIPIDRYNYDISNDILNGKIKLDEVEKAPGRIRKGEASGIDGIPIELYSSDIKYFTPLLTTLFNTIFVLADYPDDWAQGLIYPVHKKGDKSDPQNYRKVSLIPSLAKVFESVLENRLSFKNLVCRDDDPLQSGF